MKRTYTKPHTQAFILQSKTHMLSQSYTVNEYRHGRSITVGDEDEPSTSRSSRGR